MPEGPFIRRFQQEQEASDALLEEPPLPFRRFQGNDALPSRAEREAQIVIADAFDKQPYDSYMTSSFHGPRMRTALSAAGRNAVNDYGDAIPLDENKYKQKSFAQFVRRNPSGVPTFRGKDNHSALGTATLTGREQAELPGYTVHDIANHEYEHARTPLARTKYLPEKLPGFGSVSDPAAEIPAVLGDLVFTGKNLSDNLGNKEYLVDSAPGYDLSPATEKRPFGLSVLSQPALEHTVHFPSGHSQNINSMVKQAEDHGYFDGKTMTELLATPEGKQYLKMVTQKPPLDYDLDIQPKLANLRDEDRFNRTMRKARQQTARENSLLDKLIGFKESEQ